MNQRAVSNVRWGRGRWGLKDTLAALVAPQRFLLSFILLCLFNLMVNSRSKFFIPASSTQPAECEWVRKHTLLDQTPCVIFLFVHFFFLKDDHTNGELSA